MVLNAYFIQISRDFIRRVVVLESKIALISILTSTDNNRAQNEWLVAYIEIKKILLVGGQKGNWSGAQDALPEFIVVNISQILISSSTKNVII